MKIATFNIQNLFHRDSELVQQHTSRNFQDWVDEFHALMGKTLRTDTDYGRLRELAFLLGFSSKTSEPYLVLRKRGGKLYVKPRGKGFEQRATAKVGWNGWVQLRSVPIDEKAIGHKAEVIAATDPDILVLQEVEDQVSLAEFNARILSKHGMASFDQLFFLEGNSANSLGMAILAKNGYSIESIRSHAHEKGKKDKPLFEIDCPEYTIITPKGESITIINGYFPEKTGDDTTKARRKAQAEYVRELYRQSLLGGREHVIVCGTLNEVTYSDALSPLFRDTHMKDISKHDAFTVDLDKNGDATYFRMGAYQKGVNIRQRDYLLSSPVLFAKLDACGMDRHGLWPKEKPQWPIYPTLKSKAHQASAHPLLWGRFESL